MTTDYERLLAACAAHPDEDTPRLMLADEVQDTDPDRAELIRVQCELARLPVPDEYDLPLRVEVRRLRDRASAIIVKNEARWRKGPMCPGCKGRGDVGLGSYRGMTCRVCGGIGDTGGLLRQFDYDTRSGVRTRSLDPVRVRFDRGFITRVEVPTLDELIREGNRQGSLAVTEGEVSPSWWLRAVLTATPERDLIREIVPLDKVPFVYTDQPKYGWDRGRPGRPVEVLPPVVFDRLESPNVYDTRDAALTALGRAIVAWARDHIALEVRT